MREPRSSLCPSAQPGMEDLQLIGVVTFDEGAPRVAYLNEVVPVTEGLLASVEPAEPQEVFRMSGRCEERRCTHFNGVDCKLATRIVQILPAVVDGLPACLIRASCRWYTQEGKAACLRCPQVVTQPLAPSVEFAQAARPQD
jgi:hypothetical protein